MGQRKKRAGKVVRRGSKYRRSAMIPASVATFGLGFTAGVSASGAYLASGSPVVWSVPAWAKMVFVTGFAAGRALYDTGIRGTTLGVVGCLTVGLTYGVISWAMFGILRVVRRRR